MKKILSLLAVLLVAASLLACGERTRVLRLADIHADGYPTVVGALAFAEYVLRESNGSIRIEVFNNAVLGDERTTMEMVQTGSLAFVRIGTNPLSAINPVMNALSMPFLFRDRAHMFSVLDGPIGDEMLTSLTSQNLLGLSWLDAGFRNFYNSQREIRTPADMAGLRIRTQESALMMDMVRMLGASPTPMSMGEVYTSLQNGVIDGAENNWPSYVNAAHFEVAPFFTVNQHMAAPEMFLINTQLWNSFSAAEQDIIKRGALHGAQVQRRAWLEAEQHYENIARAAGNTITVPTPAELQLFADALMPLYDQPAYAQFAPIIERIRNVR
ncbi:MAG: TRAP transporter substrate-binding protein [Spirochaetaceae bacterium]|nr:TRAP transporter substrate-binding protein [Spirochaetaceae bacterium]